MTRARGTLASLSCLLPLLIFSFFVKLPSLPIRAWDEARNANSALEMYLHHHWLAPTYDRVPDMWNTKPPLLIWLQVAAMHLFGIGELSVRLPSALAALATGVLLWAFCDRYCGKPWTGFLAGAVLASTVAYIFVHAGRSGDYDALLTLFLTAYALSAFLYTVNGDRKWIGAFWLFATLAALTKGVAGLTLFPAVVLFVIVERRFVRLLRDPAVYAGGIGFLLVIGGYFLLREHDNPGYWNAVMANDVFGRYVEGLGAAGRFPFLFYVGMILIRDPYWIYFLLPAFLAGVLSGSPPLRRVSLFNLIVVISFWLTISLGRTKLEWYALPLYPFFSLQIGILLGVVWERLAVHIGRTGLRRVAAGVFAAAVFSVPLVQVARYVFKADEDPWDVELEAQAHFLQHSIRTGADLRNYVFCYGGYNGPANFYVKLLRARGVYVEARGPVRNLAPGMHVVVSEEKARGDLEAMYTVQRIEERLGCTVYSVQGIAPDTGNGDLRVLRATYGSNCGVQAGNATGAVQRECDGRWRCNFEMLVQDFGDPAPGCAKEFDVEWQCGDPAEPRAVKVPAEAGFGSVARLACDPPRAPR
jgi:4-amino-4-deoxy-L-arabinose transferase-like glycosyltransferase